MVDQLKSIGMTVLGIVLSLIPPALWVAWTETVLLVVAAVGVVSAALLVVLANSQPEGDEGLSAPHGAGARTNLSKESIAEIHRIFPLTYHHSLIEKARFRQTMEKVRQLLK